MAGRNTVSTRGFVPGLVLGLVVGAFAGAVLPPVLSGQKLPVRPGAGAPVAGGAREREEMKPESAAGDPARTPQTQPQEAPPETAPTLREGEVEPGGGGGG